jgi:hypothetical protein
MEHMEVLGWCCMAVVPECTAVLAVCTAERLADKAAVVSVDTVPLHWQYKS